MMEEAEKRKRLVIWGIGKIGRRLLKDREIKAAFAIDRNLGGTVVDGIEVKTPDEIEEWKNLFICITTSKYEMEIKEELSKKGLVEERDFISYREMQRRQFLANRRVMDVNDILIRNLLQEKEFERKIYDRAQWEAFWEENSAIKIYSRIVSDIVKESPKQAAPYEGYCEVCGRNSAMRMDFRYAVPDTWINWRENVVCLTCGCNSRSRFMLGRLQKKIGEGVIYINECLTDTYRILKRNYPNVIGSEYYGTAYKSGEEVNGVRNEDAMSLSFHDKTIDYYISNDVFEHVSDYKKAYAEAYRVLKKNGRLLFTVPFDTSRNQTRIRARMDETGAIEHLLPPVYHENPLSAGGSLVFNDFGWDMITDLREIGFKEAYMLYRFSTDKAYLGHNILLLRPKNKRESMGKTENGNNANTVSDVFFWRRNRYGELFSREWRSGTVHFH